MKRMTPLKSDKNRMKKYVKAFEKFSNSEHDKFEIKEYWENGPALTNYCGKVYRVDSTEDMYNHIKNSLTVIDSAMHLPLSLWIEVAEEVHLVPEFTERLIVELGGPEEFSNLNLAFNLSRHASNSANVFWNTLYSLDDIELYPKAIIAASQTYNFESMLEEVMELMISEGVNVFNQMQDGVFETIDLNEDDASDESIFYIYTVDPISWNVEG